ncbi:MAG: leucine--tRNA ligase [Candidatus Heimdallarchaeaceae archaeon]
MTFLDEIRQIEKKWQKKWQDDQIFIGKIDHSRPKWFITLPYPYASGAFHLGHARTYNIGDVITRFKRQRGNNVLWPMAFHITGTPVLSVSWKIKNKDEQEWQKYRDYVAIYEDDNKIIEEIVATFEKPENVATYFANKIINDFLGMGFSIDDTKQFTTGDLEYNKFIEWQYGILNEKNLITKGAYPILWCVNDKNAVGEDDIKDGDVLKVEVNEFVGIKFELDNGAFLVAATLRPETIFGATNIWIHPDANYEEIQIDNERWIVSEEATIKLMEQDHKIVVQRKLKGKEIVNQEAIVPITGLKIPIYPATFVDTDHATGVVYSVPAHAPYDYAALVDLQRDEETIEEYNLSRDRLGEIKPISLIIVKGYGEFPAVELCEKLGVKSQKDREKLEEATQTIYKDEFYSGVMKENTGDFKGLKVEKAKDVVADKLRDNNLAVEIYETSREAFCRCGAQIIVAVLQEQYFLNYGDEKWKETAFKALNSMSIIPEKYRLTFENTFNWLDKRPCVRKRGLGTEFPLTKGEGWIIESLSDSVIYMAFYTVIKIIRENQIKPEQLKPELFDFVFLNKGSIEKVMENTAISEDSINAMKESFEYWYPNDFRHTAITHISNHLSFTIFHHVAIFPEKYWVKAFSLNENLINNGEAMSKSKGNVIPIAHIPEKYSVDLTRLHLASVATADSVLDWREAEVNYAQQRLKKFWEYATSITSVEKKEVTLSFPSKILVSSVNSNLKKALDVMENYNVREFILNSFFTNLRSIDDYEKLAEHIPKEETEIVLRKIIERIILVISPVIPHLCEELNERMGNKQYISLAEIPDIIVSEEDKSYALQAKYLANLQEDIEQVIKLVKSNPKKIHIYINAEWKNKLYDLAKRIFEDEAVNIGKIMTEAKQTPELSNHMKDVSDIVKLMMKDPSIFRIEMISSSLQKNAVGEYKEFLSRIFNGAEIIIHTEDQEISYDPQNKARKARPMKPALLLE